MTAAEDIYRQAFGLPMEERRELVPMEERRELVQLIADSVVDDASDLDPADVAAAMRELQDHRRDPTGSLSAAAARDWFAARRRSR